MPPTAVIAIRSLERAARDGAAAILGLTPFAALIGLSALWVLWSPSDIFTDHPRLIMWTVGLLFAKVMSSNVTSRFLGEFSSVELLTLTRLSVGSHVQMVMHMMLSHMSEEPYWLLRKTFMIQLAVSLLLVVGVVPWVRACVCTWAAALKLSVSGGDVLVPHCCMMVLLCGCGSRATRRRSSSSFSFSRSVPTSTWSTLSSRNSRRSSTSTSSASRSSRK